MENKGKSKWQNTIRTSTTVGADSISALSDTRAEMDSAPTPAIPEIVQSFKRHTTIKYIEMVKRNIAPPFEKRICQRNYYEHIIRKRDFCTIEKIMI